MMLTLSFGLWHAAELCRWTHSCPYGGGARTWHIWVLGTCLVPGLWSQVRVAQRDPELVL